MQIQCILTPDEPAVLQVYLVCRRSEGNSRSLLIFCSVIVNIVTVLERNARCAESCRIGSQEHSSALICSHIVFILRDESSVFIKCIRRIIAFLDHNLSAVPVHRLERHPRLVDCDMFGISSRRDQEHEGLCRAGFIGVKRCLDRRIVISSARSDGDDVLIYHIVAQIVNHNSCQIAASCSVCAVKGKLNISIFSHFRKRCLFADLDLCPVQRHCKIVVIISGYRDRRSLLIRGNWDIERCTRSHLRVASALRRSTRAKLSCDRVDLDAVILSHGSLHRRALHLARLCEIPHLVLRLDRRSVKIAVAYIVQRNGIHICDRIKLHLQVTGIRRSLRHIKGDLLVCRMAYSIHLDL